MARRVNVAQAKAQLSDLLARVAHRGEHFVIERRGKPTAALVTVDELETLEQDRATSERPLGALAMVGAWRELEDRDIDSILNEIYAERARDTGRQVEIDR